MICPKCKHMMAQAEAEDEHAYWQYRCRHCGHVEVVE